MSVKKYIVLTLIAFFLVGIVLLVRFVPSHYYTVALNQGLESDFLNVRPAEDFYYKGKVLALEDDLIARQNDRFWRDFHFSHFIVPIPIRHPLFLLRPHIVKNEREEHLLGLALIDQNSREFARLVVKRPRRFDFELGRDQLFELPLFYNKIFSHSFEQMWRDLFTKDLLLRKGDTNFISNYQKLKDHSLQELAYNLFILRNRQRLFPEIYNYSALYEEKNLGVIHKDSTLSDSSYHQEIYYWVSRGIIYPFKFYYLPYSQEALEFRQRFLSSLDYQESSADSALPIYAQYRQLNYQDRISHQGLIYLYMAWSHVPDRESFMREMIRFIERGDEGHLFLDTLYDYAYEKFGTTFSTIHHETNPEIYLQERIRQELQEEIERERAREIVVPDDHFNSLEERMLFFLERARNQELKRQDQ